MIEIKANYRTPRFVDIKCLDDTKKWDNASDFLSDWKACGLYTNGLVKDASISTLYHLLYARYGNSHILNADVNQFKYKVWSIIFQYAPTWEKELEIQASLRGLTLTDGSAIFEGSKMIYNHAYNPSNVPTTELIPTVDDQNTTAYKKSKLEGLNALDILLKADVTENFIVKFKKLFKQFVSPDYYTIKEEE